MHYGVKMENWGNKWRSAMEEPGGGYSRRTLDDEEEKRFWHTFMKDRSEYHPDEYSLPIAEKLKDIIRPYHPDTILEIGPGWGNYTFMLAELCSNMICTDISRDVLNYIRKTGELQGFPIRTEESKWEEYNGPSADIIFGFNCFYRMQKIEDCLKKINQLANSLCIIGMTSGPEQPYYREMEQKLELEINYHRLDYIYLVNILYQLGIDCNVAIIPLKKRYHFSSLEEAARKESQRIIGTEYHLQQIEEILSRYLQPDPDNGFYYDHMFCGALLYWEPRKADFLSQKRLCPHSTDPLAYAPARGGYRQNPHR